MHPTYDAPPLTEQQTMELAAMYADAQRKDLEYDRKPSLHYGSCVHTYRDGLVWALWVRGLVSSTRHPVTKREHVAHLTDLGTVCARVVHAKHARMERANAPL